MRARGTGAGRGTGWQARVRHDCGRPLLRVARIVALLLAVTGCAIEGPLPVATPERPPPPPVLAPTPVPPPVVSRFGEWRGAGGSPRSWQHAGIDIRAGVGTPVLAAADGVVLRAGAQALAGKLVVLQHAPDLATVYYHLSQIAVRAGQTVLRGEVIGRAGDTGNATVPHLHFGVCRREEARCGEGIQSGWIDPVTLWVETNPCFDPDRRYPAEPLRLTYPVPCATT